MSFYDWFYESGGEQFEISRGDKTFTADGINNYQEKIILFKPDTDVRVGDWVKRAHSDDWFHVLDTYPQYEVGRGSHVFSQNASYETKAAYDRRMAATPQPGPTVTIEGNVYGSPIATSGGRVEMHNFFTFGDLDRLIEERGGQDRAALRQIVRELRQQLEEHDTLSKGWLGDWLLSHSLVLNQHAWIVQPLAVFSCSLGGRDNHFLEGIFRKRFR